MYIHIYIHINVIYIHCYIHYDPIPSSVTPGGARLKAPNVGLPGCGSVFRHILHPGSGIKVYKGFRLTAYLYPLIEP